MYSKYKIIKILGDCVQNMFFLDQANSSFDPSEILVLSFLIPGTSLPPSPSLTNFTLFNWNPYSTQFFIGFPILSYPIQPRSTTSIGYTKQYERPKSNQQNLSSSCIQIIIYRSLYLMSQTCYLSKSWVFKSHFSFKVRQHGQQQLYL